MQNTQKSMKTMSGHGFTQFELTQSLLQNLNKFKLTPTAKLVLMYLSSCYNPKKADIFPKQKTIAIKLGVSEASVIRAVCELHKGGLIISERKYTNRYKFTSYFLTSLGILDNNMQVENSQNEIKETCKMQPVYMEQKKEQENNNEEEDKILLKAIEHKTWIKNKVAYINTIKRNGGASAIISEMQKAENAQKYWDNQVYETQKRNEEVRNFKGDAPTEAFRNVLKLYRR